jgi:hypothetical protein
MAPFLETGDGKTIDNAKTEYRKKYKAEWRKTKRRQIKEITTAWEKEEYKSLKEEAIRHKESITRFIKKATVGYMNKRYVTPNEMQVTKVMQLLALTYNCINELKDESNIPAEAGRKLLFDIHQLEREIRIELFSPKTIEQSISEYILEKPQVKPQLIEFIQTIPV